MKAEAVAAATLTAAPDGQVNVVAADTARSDSDVVISVRNVGKMYRLYDRPQDRLKEQLLWRLGRHYGREFWALRDVSFKAKKGEVLGIIGRNGSGKSTLLQIIAGTLAPTLGEVRVEGRLAALLELGSGFNFEFTGRENVFLNGAVLGISREEMEERFGEIEAFADIGEFINQSVKVYSSGMIVRLAFAVNALLDPDILIVDEALAVGDEGFQRKCFGWIEQLQQRNSAILFVSHSMAAISNLCDRAILLERGRVHLAGDTRMVVKEYHRLVFGAPTHHAVSTQQNTLPEIQSPESTADPDLFDQKAIERALLEGTWTQPIVRNTRLIDLPHMETRSQSTSEKRYGHGEATIQAVGLFDKNLEPVRVLDTRQTVAIILDVVANEAIYDYGFGFVIEDKLGNAQFSATTQALPKEHLPTLRPGQQVQIAFVFTNLLLTGSYYLSCGMWRYEDGKFHHYDRRVDVLRFEVATKRIDVWGVADFGARIGLFFPQPH